MISLSLPYHKREGNDKGKQLSDDDGIPNSVDIKDHGQEDHRRHLEDKGSHKGHKSGDKSVIERGEERGAEYCHSAESK